MSLESDGRGSVRSAAAVNEDIRALLVRTGGWLSAEDRAVYERLVAEWSAAVRGEVIEAA
ncbi:hypothetical protein GCM10014715_81560 [Streptomyces spiralis]|uniref:Uncharacterized protein n=1 Tax=Streptomyces spiralis TaxID=66376 RepID=A0A919E2S9_9ACTN|nr:hypothetical protein [Streptomyces spiralis]GHF13663.1 hypothetical protein GCM10014715_81560 [Streptomyces spiralis]